MRKLSKEQLPLVIAFSLPVLLILFVWIANILPRLFLKPQYDFLYYYQEKQSYDYSIKFEPYKIDPFTKKISKGIPERAPGYVNYGNEVDLEIAKTRAVYPVLYLHDVESNKSTPITFEQATKYIIDSSQVSPDGYKVKNGRRAGYNLIFPESYTDYDQWVISKGGASISLDLAKQSINTYDYYNNSINILGWKVN